jgi:site-specific recombinase XerD
MVWATPATHLLEDAYDICAEQELFGHKDVSTPMIHAHVMNPQEPDPEHPGQPR